MKENWISKTKRDFSLYKDRSKTLTYPTNNTKTITTRKNNIKTIS